MFERATRSPTGQTASQTTRQIGPLSASAPAGAQSQDHDRFFSFGIADGDERLAIWEANWPIDTSNVVTAMLLDRAFEIAHGDNLPACRESEQMPLRVQRRSDSRCRRPRIKAPVAGCRRAAGIVDLDLPIVFSAGSTVQSRDSCE